MSFRQEWRVPVGEATTTARLDAPQEPPYGRLLVLAHSAGGSMNFRTMNDLTRSFPSVGLPVVRFNFLYRELGKGPPDRMPSLQTCFAAAVESTRSMVASAQLFVGGHSMGGRAASMMCAEGFDCSGLILLGYPLHPAGQTEKLRDAHLPGVQVRTLCLSGTRDDLCLKPLMEQVLGKLPSTFNMHWIESADHSFNVLKSSGRSREDVFDEIAVAVDAFTSPMAASGTFVEQLPPKR